ncbi:hypothetical protein [Streptomyces sp. TP-A0356]|uniref:hypothetical protein n=1 Tax=Streptomyces sp. TP-A0356 TaxID=1359208 RepID=UPI0006E27065|nr:hypothetical protein [Streptomyces sp. TP-A0356]
MAKSSTARASAPDTVWLARGRHLGAGAEERVRQRLRELKSGAVIQDRFEFDGSGDGTPGRAFEARWLVDGDVVVRARLNVGAPDVRDGTQDWVLVAEADRAWDLDWPSPATVFWPEDADAPWDHDVVPDLRFRDINPLPTEDRALRRLLKECARHTWSIHVVVHEAMTTDERGRRPLAPMLPPSLRHRVVEHRAAPEQFQVVNWALYDLGVRVPRGGAVVLPAVPAGPGTDDNGFSVRTVFLDGTEPTDLIDTVRRYAERPAPLPDGAEEALAELREQWHLTTLEEELAQTRRQLAAYAEALDAMTKSRDLYREAAELAHEALAAYQESGTLPPPRQEERKREGFSLRTLAKPLERVRDGAKLLRTPSSEGHAPRTTDPDGETSVAGPSTEPTDAGKRG